SPHPDVKLPETSCWHFLFDNQTSSADDRVVFADGQSEKKLRFGELRSLTKRLAYGLVNRAKLGHDDVIMAFSPNMLLYPAFVQAAQAATVCVSLANPSYLLDELVHHIKDSRPKVLVVGKPIIEVAKKAAIECCIAESNIYMMEDDVHEQYQSIWSLAGTEELEPRRLSPHEAKQRTAFMCYSSGTTGKAKGVETTHYNLTSVITQVIAREPSLYTDKEKWLAALPLYHIYGVLCFIFLSPYCRATTYIFPRFEPELWLKSIQKYRITMAHIVPPIAVLLAKHPAVDKYDVSSLNRWACGAAPLGNDLIDVVEKRTKIPVRGGYGMTETTCVISVATLGADKPGSVGKLIPNMSAKLVDGELFIKGPNIMKGYLRNPRADKETFTDDGWMRTGDVCWFDEGGNLFIVDRVKELIKFKGFQVPPAVELEDLLLQHADVEDAAVIGVYDDEQATELPRAYIVLSAGAKGKKNVETAIAAWVSERVANHKRLRGGVGVIDAIPKSPSGKILRRLLRDEAGSKKTSVKL
ncbi:hypothetical protein PILCRDRAFT_75136, partial [Piloderma croceum F 1598]